MISYNLSDEERQNGSKQVPPITVRWVSGACTTTETKNVRLWTDTYQNAYRFGCDVTIMRPPDAPNAQIDAAYGAQLEQNSEIRDQGVRNANAIEEASKKPKVIFVAPLY
jgi:hypothetical protein